MTALYLFGPTRSATTPTAPLWERALHAAGLVVAHARC